MRASSAASASRALSGAQREKFDRMVDEHSRNFIEMVLHLVEAAHWRFGRMRSPDDALFFAACNAADPAADFQRFRSTYRNLRRRGALGVTTVADGDYPHALAISIPDPAADVAVLVLLRSGVDDAFTPYERSLLQLVRELGEELFSAEGDAQRDAASAAAASAAMRRTAPILFILDRSYKIVIGHRSDLDSEPALRQAQRRVPDRLPDVIEQAVRHMTVAWAEDPRASVHVVTMPLPFLAVHVHSMEGRDGNYLAVSIERLRRRNVLHQASERFTITPREREVLAYLLDGMRIETIADRLSIAPSTVNDHVKSLIARTRAHNRSQMLARVLGWEGEDGAES